MVPPKALQEEFGRTVDKVTELATSYRTQSAEFDALFASLQHRAFRGEL